jgi:DNA-binding ferritin-like protein
MEKLKELFNMLVIYQYNIRVLHWKCAGTNFSDMHGTAEAYISKFDEYIDETSEILLMNHIYPPTLMTVMNEAQNSERELLLLGDNDQYFDFQGFVHIISRMFHDLLIMYNDINHSEEYTEDIKSKLQEQQYYIRKELKYKNYNKLAN